MFLNRLWRLSLVTVLVGMFLAGCGTTPGWPGVDLPIELYFRESSVGSGYVVQVKNTSDKSVQVNLQALGHSEEFVLAGNQVKEFGLVQGFKFASKDEVVVSANGYGDKYVMVP